MIDTISIENKQCGHNYMVLGIGQFGTAYGMWGGGPGRGERFPLFHVIPLLGYTIKYENTLE